jgi:hypothetical protein
MLPHGHNRVERVSAEYEGLIMYGVPPRKPPTRVVLLESSAALNPFALGGVLLYVQYSTCIMLLLHYGRQRFASGPFWFAQLRYTATIGTIAWSIESLVVSR